MSDTEERTVSTEQTTTTAITGTSSSQSEPQTVSHTVQVEEPDVESRQAADAQAKTQFKKKFGSLTAVNQNVLNQRKQERKYFDSADFYREKQGVHSPTYTSGRVMPPSNRGPVAALRAQAAKH